MRPAILNLSVLDELERRYDGPIPPQHFESAETRLMQAAGMAAFYEAQARAQRDTVIAPRRLDGTLCTYMLADLDFYERSAEDWRREETRLRRQFHLVENEAG